MSARATGIRVAVVVLAVLFGGGSGAAIAAPVAADSSLPATVALADMLPGEARTTVQILTVPVPARIVTAHWSTVGDADWDVELCDSSDCVPFESLEDTQLTAGEHELRATVRLSEDVAQGASASAAAEIRLVESSERLAATGGVAPLAALAAGVSGLAAGLALLIAARRWRGKS